MSRHSHWIDDKTELVAGFDTRPIPSYFVQKFVDDEPVYSVSTDPMATLTPHPDYPTNKRWSQQELAELIIKEGGPKAWSDAMFLDVQF